MRSISARCFNTQGNPKLDRTIVPSSREAMIGHLLSGVEFSEWPIAIAYISSWLLHRAPLFVFSVEWDICCPSLLVYFARDFSPLTNPSLFLFSLYRWGIWVFSSCSSSLSLQRWEWSCLVTWVRAHAPRIQANQTKPKQRSTHIHTTQSMHRCLLLPYVGSVYLELIVVLEIPYWFLWLMSNWCK